MADGLDKNSDEWIKAEQAKHVAGSKRPLIGCGVLILIAVGVVAVVAMSSGGGSSEYDNDNEYEAISQCEARIEALLKSPSTASFTSSAKGSGTWTVEGSVDSENGFGATIRSDFQCTVIMGDESATTTVDFLE